MSGLFSRRLCLFCLLFLLSVLAAVLFDSSSLVAQDNTPPLPLPGPSGETEINPGEPDTPSENAAFDLESQARKHEGRGDYEESIKKYKEALFKAVELAQKAQGEQARRYWAEAEIYLDRAVSLMNQVPSPDYRDMVSFLDGLGADGKLVPVVDGWRKWLLAKTLIRTGKTERIKKIVDELGFVTNWMVIGPFQNERGGFFAVPYGPENELDFQAAYDGKKRKVRWRKLPVSPLYGEVDFDAIMRPRDEVLAYALAFVEVPDDVDAALRIGSDEGLRVWVNDFLVIDRDIHRSMGFDQDAVGVKLTKGLNKILVKVGERNGNWGFRLRITDPKGGRVEFTALESLEDFEKAQYSKCTEASGIEVDRGAIGYYTGQAEKMPGDIVAQAHLGYLHLVRPFEDENAYKDRAAFEKCIELEPDNPYYRFMFAESYQQQTSMEAEKETNKVRLATEKAVELEPEYVEALMHLAEYYLKEMQNWHKAKEYLDRALAVNPDYFHALILEIEILNARQFNLEAALKTRALETHEKKEIQTSPVVLQKLMELYESDSRVQKVTETVNLALRQNYSAYWARNKLIQHYRRTGKLEEVLKQYDIYLDLFPYEISFLVQRARVYESMDEFEKAVSEIDRALEICPEAEEELVKKGNLLMRISLEKNEDSSGEIYAEALKVFEKARRINPNNTWLKRYLEFLQEEKKSFEEHERLAAEVELKVDDAVYIKSKKLVTDESGAQSLEEVVEKFDLKELDKQAAEENLPFLCILSKQVTDVRKDGTSSEFTHFVIRICNDVGTQRFRYFPAGYFMTAYNQEVKIKKARVIHENGTEEEGRSMGYAIMFPKLKVGDILDVQFRIDDQMTDLTERFFGDYYGKTHFFHNTFYFGEIAPIKLSQYYLILPMDREFYFNYLNIEAEPVKQPGLNNKTEMYVWQLRDLPHLVPEILMPPHDQFLPAMQISSFKDWKEFGKWFYNLIKKQYDMSPDMKKKVQELVKGKETELEKIRAIYNFVVTDISYQAWEYGIHGWQPYKASTIFARKFGDCKDKALLINVMLREVGIESLPVLIEGTNNRGEHDMTLPMIRHFNHCISYAPPSGERKEGIWMDGTAEFYGLTDGPPFMDWGATTLVVNEKGGVLRDVPLPDPVNNVQSENTLIELLANGSARIKTKLTVDGDNAANVRRQFSVEGRREVLLGDLYGQRFAGAKVLSTEFPDLKDLNLKSLTYGYELEIPDFVKKTPEGLSLTHDLFAVPWSTLTPQAERKHKMVLPYVLGLAPLVMPLPGTLQTNTTYVLPKGHKVMALPKNEKFSSDFADFDLVFEKEEGEQPKVFVKRSLTMKKNNLGVEDYSKLRELTNLLEKIQKEKVIIKGAETPEKPPKEDEKEPENGEEPVPEPPDEPGK